MSGNEESRKDSVQTSGPSDNLVEETLLHIFLSCEGVTLKWTEQSIKAKGD